MLPALVALLLLHHAARAAPRASNQTKAYKTTLQHDALWSRLAHDGEDRASIIAVLNSKKLLMTRFRHVCGTHQTNNPAAKSAGVPAECWRLKGACRLFEKAIIGEQGVQGHDTPPVGFKAWGDC